MLPRASMLAVCLGLIGCAARPRTAAVTRPVSPALDHTAAVSPVATPKVDAAIQRSELAKVLAASPGVFLAHLDASPTFINHRFAGWRLNAFFPGDPRFAGVDIRSGDIITRVNGHRIERPEEFMEVWQEAGRRSDLSVELWRDGQPKKMVWTIDDSP